MGLSSPHMNGQPLVNLMDIHYSYKNDLKLYIYIYIYIDLWTNIPFKTCSNYKSETKFCPTKIFHFTFFFQLNYCCYEF